MAAFNLKEVPSTPGIYKFFSKNRIIYIGKAKNLKKRVSSYFGKSFKDRKTYQIKILTDKIETFSTSSEAEALLLEQSLIKENLPRFNILLRDDKTYPYVHFSMDQEFPSINMRRTKHAVSKNFFGPFISVQAVKSTIKDLQKIYQIRNCSDSTFKNRSRPCIEHQMQRCSAPCVGLIGVAAYQDDISSSQQYLSSTGKQTKSLMVSQMKKFANEQEFEKANELKKRIKALDLLHQEQSFSNSLISADIFSCISRFEKTGVSILSIRDGKVRGAKTHYLNGNHLNDIDGLFQSLIFSYYQSAFSLPEKIFLTTKPTNLSLIKDAVLLKFNKDIPILTNMSQELRKLAKLGELNANQVIENKINQFDKYKYALKDLASYIGTAHDSLTIEGYDVSHHSGNYAVASLVKFSNQGPDKSAYKIFNIPKELSGNDVGSIKHILERRLQKENSNTLPDIILIDGGYLQLNIALKVFNNKNQKTPLILSIVKGSNRVRATETILSEKGVLEMPKDSPGFILLQQIRDESHRFAIARNRKIKNKAVKYSELDAIHGIGLKKKKALIKHFKSLKALKAASLEEICMVEGINSKLAKKVYNLKH
jgi:excinuclease ABC subunit C